MRSSQKFKCALASLAMLGTTLLGSVAASAGEPPQELAAWLGKERTVDASALDDHIPRGGKLTLVYDDGDDVVRVCTRSVIAQRQAWREDLAQPCNVALTFKRGMRYCTYEEVKAGNAEVLATCHRLRNSAVAMHPALAKGALELHDTTVFLLVGPKGEPAGLAISIDAPSRLTHEGVIHATQ